MIFLGIGSSIGNAEKIFDFTEKFLKSNRVLVKRKSNILKNPAIGGVAKNEFQNAVWEISVPDVMSPWELLGILKRGEFCAGRDFSRTHWDDRELDLDILIFHDLVLSAPDLNIPHPEIKNRNFVLQPLTELVDENFKIPTLGPLRNLLKKHEN
ncbi:2-amino-4-hydroxy-6-hydroxymethyldihydropteridine diphosphokinase [bacterium]|jgi:2-amino-4-hydroxy-6-hydroxymethyldihydropteridine diphosphokinase|nr:2-amino-4-hydroxy-6-hydroxymethyldihydropteridine diphosphokinase [bacterium]MBT6832041.1 2-amino-4-hydroxy-6-hydroxymethyldihydropteridine diphosphokinase [bacterium]MBT6995822.1 2-amino-4-hydroxy-6-hydroxymethyldihydropteridine diphosphokinase [bacterium]MBT7772367.1 2-amino-4-hydroxy-6-hydroxymethyldihydropteridine diphosphokinase [bacterium]